MFLSMSMKKRTAAGLLALCLLCCAFTAFAASAMAAPALTVVRQDVSRLSANSAQLNGYVNSYTALSYTHKGLYLSTSRDNLKEYRYTSGMTGSKTSFSFGFAPEQLNTLCGRLHPGTVYYYKLFVMAGGREYASDIGWFRTTDEKTDGKTVITAFEPAAVSCASTLLGGQVSRNDYGFTFSKIVLLLGGSADSLGEAASLKPSGRTPQFTFDAARYRTLAPLSTYYYQFCAMTPAGASYVSAVRSFTTPAPYSTVLLDPNGGALSAPATLQLLLGAPYTLPVPVLAGYAFAGWYAFAPNAQKALIPIAQTGVWPYGGESAPITLYAQWTQTLPGTALGTADGLTLSFDLNYPNAPTLDNNLRVVKPGKQFGKLPKAERPGYKLAGWYTAAEGGTQVSAESKAEAAGSLPLYAHWTGRTYKITFNANGGSVSPASTELRFGDTYQLPQPTREGYIFAGWYTAKAGGDVKPQVWTMDIPSKATLYAQWTQTQYIAPSGVQQQPAG